MDDRVAAIDEAVSRFVDSSRAGLVVGVDQPQRPPLDRDEHGAGMTVPAGVTAARDDDLLRDQIGGALRLDVDARLGVDKLILASVPRACTGAAMTPPGGVATATPTRSRKPTPRAIAIDVRVLVEGPRRPMKRTFRILVTPFRTRQHISSSGT